MKFLRWTGIALILLIILYFIGPKPSSPHYTTQLPTIPSQLDSVERYVSTCESKFPLKADNEARIVWANDSIKSKTEYAVVYLHGFSASQEEGDPVHRYFSWTFGCNLYLSRISDHGIRTDEQLLHYTAERAWTSAKEAFAIGKQLGKKVILMATSTGGTLALKLAAEYPEIAGLILLSPNIAINDPLAWVANNHWGLQIAHLAQGKYYTSSDSSDLYKQYWSYKYRMEAIVQMQELLETTMKAATFEKIRQPTLVLYYYKDDDHQDEVVKVSAMKRMFHQLGTPDSLKKLVAIPNAGDHVIGSYIKSKDVHSVIMECTRFGAHTLKLPLNERSEFNRGINP
ncbi:MAG TPA: alpha/beta fold hydrolase [Chitinophagaceae bacterium]